MRTAVKAMMVQLKLPVLLVLLGSHGQVASWMPWPLVLWAGGDNWTGGGGGGRPGQVGPLVRLGGGGTGQVGPLDRSGVTG